ncbi:MAG TPA: serine hydrolase domain-containing protein [Actinomycetes bacterium]|nr:serine hydrolase domain-containing protein [Actinomycetes bacterium]
MTSPNARYPADQLAKIVEPHFQRALEAENAPGIAYGLIVDGDLVHTAACGVSQIDTTDAPGPHRAFRIASMTKSFTATTVLSLRDAGLLSLDTPVVDLVPELAAGGPPTEEITVRHLLTMGGGFLTDDPWGDRQQDLEIDAFRALLTKGVRPHLPPGDLFEYSNMGYALLGLVISAVSDLPYTEAVRQRVLEPLGLRATGFDPMALEAEDVATGYVRRTAGWQEEPIAASGAFSPMGGLLSTVADLARWVGFFSSDDDDDRVIRPLSRREMQRTQRLVGASASRDEGAPPTVVGYGFGLFEEFTPWGRTVFHSGGYPGFGSHMRWHPASGIGIVALANGTYAPMGTVAAAALADVVKQTGAPTTPPATQIAGLDAAEAAVRRWLAADDRDGPEGEALRTLWADNVERDLPWAERLGVMADLDDRYGPLVEVPDSTRRPSPGAVTWELEPERDTPGDAAPQRIRVTLMVAPHDSTLIQSLAVREVSQQQVQQQAQPGTATDVR